MTETHTRTHTPPTPTPTQLRTLSSEQLPDLRTFEAFTASGRKKRLNQATLIMPVFHEVRVVGLNPRGGKNAPVHDFHYHYDYHYRGVPHLLQHTFPRFACCVQTRLESVKSNAALHLYSEVRAGNDLTPELTAFLLFQVGKQVDRCLQDNFCCTWVCSRQVSH